MNHFNILFMDQYGMSLIVELKNSGHFELMESMRI